MRNYSTELAGGDKFDPVQWMAEEMLWGIVKDPFPSRWQRWQDENRHQNEAGINLSLLSRSTLYKKEAKPNDPEMLAKAAQNIGKLASGVGSHVVHFGADPVEWHLEPASFTHDIHSVTKRVIDAAVVAQPLRVDDTADGFKFERAITDLSKRAQDIGPNPCLADRAQLGELATRSMGLAAACTAEWLDFIDQNDGNFEMIPGGTPRSSSAFTEERMEIFEAIPRPW